MKFLRLSDRLSPSIRWKLFSVSQNHIRWYQLCFFLRVLFIFVLFFIIIWNWTRLSKLRIVEEDDFTEVPTNDTVFSYPKDPDIQMPDYRFSHPFENSCHYPILQVEDPSIEPFVEHSRNVVCPPATFEHLMSQDIDGEFLIGQPFGGKTVRSEIECYYRELTGALWPKIADYKLIGQWNRLPINQRFQIEKDQFVVKCWSNLTQHMVYHNAFANIPPKLNPPNVNGRFNIAILQIDSTSRNQFFRHAPKTLKFMHQNDFQILRGYTKIGDNSAINTLALLAGRVFEIKHRALEGLMREGQYLNENQTFGDIFKHVEMLFTKMKDEGCATMFNDDIGKATGGLFHYQAFNGFRKSPTDYYFRPYYTYIYKNMNAESVCVNGEFMIPKWLNLWERFSTLYKKRCHFSFNHISYFTHANGNNLENYDQPLIDALQRMKNSDVFEDTVILILGDHGQRIHKIKYTHYGKVEERMPFAAIHLPEKLRNARPELYEQLVRNTNRFTSTFDLHETLKDLIEMRQPNKYKLTSKSTKRVGRSLFEEIPVVRDCKDAKVPINFCVCTEILDEKMEITILKNEAIGLIRNYLNEKFSSLSCVLEWGMNAENTSMPTIRAITSLVRYGPRYMEEWEKKIVADPQKANIFREIVDLEQNMGFWIRPISKNANSRTELDAIFRFQHNRIFSHGLVMLEEAWIQKSPCPIFHLGNLCKCFK